MKRLMGLLMAGIFTATILVINTQVATKAQKTQPQANQDQGAKTPMMVAFDDLKWTALPERPGMQFSVLTGDPKTGSYTQIRKVPAGTDILRTPTAMS